jgi:hypothetical protein
MGNGYTRNDTANNIADGNVINASDLDGEFDKLQTAFDGTTGHSHDGTTGEGPQIDTTGIANDAVTGDKLADNIQIAGTLGVTGETTLSTHLNMGDNDIIKLGDSADLQIYHDGVSNGTFIQESGTGNLIIDSTNLNIRNATGTKVYMNATDGGAVTLRYDGGISLQTTSTGVDVTGELQSDSLDVDGNADISGSLTMGGNIDMQDDDELLIGTGDDLRLYHTSSNSYIDSNGAGNLYIRQKNNDYDVIIESDDSVGGTTTYFQADGSTGESRLFHYGTQKLNTKSDGVLIGGELEATTLDINGNADISGQLTMHNNVNLQDNDILQLGSSQDLQIYHDGTNSFIKDNGTGGIFMRATSNIKMESTDGNRVLAEFVDSAGVNLYYNNSNKLQTKSDGVDITGELQSDSLDVDGNANISGTLTMGGNINIQDGDTLRIGTGADLRLYHDGSDSYIDDIGTGDLYIRANDQLRLQKYTGENMIICNVDNAVQLYYDNAQKMQTTSDGIYVTGNVQSTTGHYEGPSAGDYMDIQSSVIDFNINSAIKVRIESDGDVHADGDVIAYSTTVPSDERLKTDIERIENATDKVSQLNGYTFTYKADGKKSAGVIAQEVEKVLPTAVSEKELPLKMDDGVAYKTVQHDQIIGLLIESIKELKQEINELKGA